MPQMKVVEQRFCPICENPLSRKQLVNNNICCSPECRAKYRSVTYDHSNDLAYEEKLCCVCATPLRKDQIRHGYISCSDECRCKARSLNHNHWTMELTQEKHEIIEGVLLGDGSLEWPKGCYYPRFTLGQGEGHKEYSEYFAKFFGLDPEKDVTLKINPKDGKDHKCWHIPTGTSPFWVPYYERWYPKGIKVIPQDFKITSLTLLHEFLSDGSLIKRSSNYINSVTDTRHAYQIKLSTFWYPLEEIQKLIQEPLKEMGFDFITIKHKYLNSEKDIALILNHQDQIPKFLNYLGKNPISCYNYKFEHPLVLNSCISV